MKALLLFAFILSFLQPLPCQIIDSFSDGNLINPSWFGDTDDFTINDENQLQLNALREGISFVYIPYKTKNNLEIRLFTQLDFAPSTNNQLSLFLMLDTPIIEIANGYSIHIGENGSDDNWELYELTDGTDSLLLEGPMGDFADDPLMASIQAIFGETSLQIGVKQNENVGFSVQGNVAGKPNTNSQAFFGIRCKYTSTRADKFIFDDLYIGPPLQDLMPPELVNLEVYSDSLILNFSERMDSASLSPMNFQVNQSIGQPKMVSFLGFDTHSILLKFETSFLFNTTYTLQLNNLSDLAGNPIIPYEIEFDRLQSVSPLIGDLVISEFLPDPTPTQGIPNAEFIEIYNPSNKTIQLDGLILEVNNRSSLFTESVLKPNEYLILCKNTSADLFELYGNVLGLSDFPLIRNESGHIALKSTKSEYLHFATYDRSRIKDRMKADGGWSFEIINPALYCENEYNWAISHTPIGGTPGSLNSVHDPSYAGRPITLEAFLANDTLIQFKLSHYLYHAPTVSSLDSLFNIEGATIRSTELLPPLFNTGHMRVSLEKERIYQAKMFPKYLECNRILEEISLAFGVAETPESSDISINEILFNPRSNGADYIEIKNVSSKILNIQSMRIGNRHNKDTSIPIGFNFGVLPQSLICLTTDVGNILEEYNVANPKWMHTCDLPSLPNTSGHVILFFNETDTIVIDVMIYDEDMQHPLLQDPEGVSLERIDCIANPLDRNNWHSAAADVGYGTPTAENSQGDSRPPNETEDKFKIVERIFAPQGISDQNLLKINYQLEKPGYVCNVSVFNIYGQSVKKLYHQTLLGTQGELIWDGKDQVDNWVSIGRYILLIDAIHPQGDIIKQKLSCVIADYF